MFGKKKQPPIKSLIAQGSRIEGNFTFTDGLRVDGEVVGDIHANPQGASILVISESASASGEIHADHVIINGTVRGPVHAFELLELQPKARIEGDVHYKALEMHQGAVISGQLRPMGEGEEKPTLKLAANNG
ncbi:bactofilin family protein [Variovorax terrae]|uniref:Polymer-forming cytoskeletal protein n=1 Tax=Variovorax terrae TaxID=2923278 RepID=A0A9X2AL21_9BURK|nr:polymer-forming cytoskeletal protein [Variovorax terrae]MCJ0761794.1 polymer-forming cytoskeletal protein [Variovorax terrae]